MATVPGNVAARVSINADLIEAARAEPRRGPAMDDVERDPMPDDKPDPDAQWDEVAGRWEVWSDEARGWVSLEDGSVQAPATPSVEVDTLEVDVEETEAADETDLVAEFEAALEPIDDQNPADD